MTTATVPTVTIFDQHDLSLIARRQLSKLLIHATADDHNLMIRIGRKLNEGESITQQERLQLYMLMMGLRLNGVIVLPVAIMTHSTGRTQTYEHICRELYKVIQ